MIMRKRFVCSKARASLAALVVTLLSVHLPAFAADDNAKCRYQKFANFTVETIGGSLVLGGKINDSPARFVADTGAVSTALTLQGVQRLSIPYGHINQSAPGVGGEAKEFYAHIENLSVGNWKGGHRDMAVVAETNISPEIDGLVGIDILYQYDLELSLAEKAVRLFRPLNCDSTRLAYWDANANEVDIRKTANRDDRDVVSIKVNGQNLRALIDSGASISLITVDAATKAGVSLDGPKVTKGGTLGGIGSRQINSWIGTFDNVSLGNEIIKNAKLTIADIWKAQRIDTVDWVDHDSQTDMILGLDFIRSHRLLISQLQRRMYFTYVGGDVFGSRLVSIDGVLQGANQ